MSKLDWNGLEQLDLEWPLESNPSMNSEIENLIREVECGESGASERLLDLVYQDLRKIAESHLSRENTGNTLQATALVHEAYLRLFGHRPDNSTLRQPIHGERHFYAAISEAMRRILVESARRKARIRHGGEFRRLHVDPESLAESEEPEDLIALDEALTKLRQVEPKLEELVRLRFFAGLSIPEVASQLGIAPRTADSHWAYARAWLMKEISDIGGGS